MGRIKESKLDNGMVGLEITYGGKDAPFGGIDASAPPMYIDPNCFVNGSGFLVVDEKLVAVGWQSLGINVTDWVWASEIFLGVGSFYAEGQYWNWMLSYTLGGGPGNPPVGIVTYNVRLWAAGYTGNISIGDFLAVAQFPTVVPATPATAQIIIEGNPATTTGTVAVTIGSDPVVNTAVGIGDTAAVVAANIVTNINGAGGSATAVVDSGFSNRINLTTTATGFVANSTALIVAATIAGGGTIPLPVAYNTFNGAMDAYDTNYGLPIDPLSWIAVGEEVFFGGPGTSIIKLSLDQGHPQLIAETQYLGANTLNKFNGQLIAAGITPGPGQVIQDPEMVIAWSAPDGEFGIWEPIFSDGTVTGAGFNQVADISDYLTGIFITPGQAIILRAQGIDYITPFSSGEIPFDFVHISNAKLGEGCQDSRLAVQYDQFGIFIGNSDIYEFAGSLIPIGKKIKNYLLSNVREQGNVGQSPRGSIAGPLLIDNNTDVYAHFLVGYSLYNYNFNNKTWISQDLSPVVGTTYYIGQIAVVLNIHTPSTISYVPTLITIGVNGSPKLWQLAMQVTNADLTEATNAAITFPEEEIAFGRDITIESCLVNVAGTAGQVLHFDISSTIQGSLTLPGTASPSIYQNYQLFFTDSSNDKITVQNPQLTFSVNRNNTGIITECKVAKIALFGSYDPNQRPV